MHFINFTSCPADPDVWMRPAIKSDGSKCYDYVLLYVDESRELNVADAAYYQSLIGILRWIVELG